MASLKRFHRLRFARVLAILALNGLMAIGAPTADGQGFEASRTP